MDEENTAPPAMDKETGIALAGDYPLNHRLRAEALVAAGKDEDPDGIISAELIADAAERLARNAAAEAEAESLEGLKKAELEKLAADEGVDLSGARSNADRAALIEEARASRTAGDAGSNEPGASAGEGEGA